ncbi:hypothetical protein SAMN04515695_3586 [Pseudovibrio sp. Tun.PSC04-5.I4]|nr:hypothetical protein SAMN04515695_3586 [Pseudovibrio sp. Tun.PSC04-5.I4]
MTVFRQFRGKQVNPQKRALIQNRHLIEMAVGLSSAKHRTSKEVRYYPMNCVGSVLSADHIFSIL